MSPTLSVVEYIDKNTPWKAELVLLRELCLSTALEETVKWGAPIYMYEGKNVVGLVAFKNHISLWFHQGVFLKDAHKKLMNVNEGKTKGLYQWRFYKTEDIEPQLILDYLNEAIANEKAGKRISVNRNKALIIPEVLQKALQNDKNLYTHFNAFTPGKKREFADYISEAKREETQLKRLDKCVDLILAGIGLHDKYKK